MTRAERWMSRVLPPRVVWASVVVGLATVGVLCGVVQAVMRTGGVEVDGPYLIYYFLITASLIAFGIWRAAWFHPALNRDYAAWLAASPWTSGKRLPGGPILLVWQDVVVVLLLSLMALLPGESHLASALVWLPLAFLGAYTTSISIANFDVGEGRTIVLVVAALLALPLAIGRADAADSPFAAPALAPWTIALIAYLAAWRGVHRVLESFPWDDARANGWAAEFNLALAPPAQTPPFVHWQGLERLSPLTWPCVAALAGLSAWGAFTWSECFERLDVRSDQAARGNGVAIMLASLIAAARLMRYCWGHLPPISPLGRIATGRWIIPGYDKVFVSPAGTILVAAIAPSILYSLACRGPSTLARQRLPLY